MTTCALVCALITAAAGPQQSDGPDLLPLRLAHEAAAPSSAAEEFALWRVGARFHAWTAYGDPANDLMGGSLYGSYNLKNLIHEDWWFTLEVARFSFDYERPDQHLFDIRNGLTVDATVDMHDIRFTAEWHPLAKDSRFDVYVGGGFGIVILSDGSAEDLPSSDIDLEANSGFELHVVVGAAVRVVGPVYLTAEFNATMIFAGWDGTERLSGRKESLDSWNTMGVAVGIEVRF